MKIVTEVDAKSRLEAFLDYIEKRAKDKAHDNNGDVIADFVEKFIVIELKRLENDKEIIEQEIEIPDQVLAEPLKAMKDKIIAGFDEFFTEKGITAAATESGETAKVSQTAATAAAPPPQATKPTTPTAPKAARTGNGHQTAFVRKLNDPEKDIIRTDFLRLNGQYEDAKKSCTLLLPQLGAEITVFQITGFVSYLHREIASGQLKVADMDAYMAFLEKHKDMWAQYNSAKYQNLRNQQSGISTTPKLKNFPKKTVA